MNLQTAIVEDSKPDAERLKQLLKKAFENENISCSCFASGDEFLRAGWREGYQVVFLDICMEGTNGIEKAQRLRAADPDLLIVFVTSSPEYVWDAFPVHPFDYLLKPYKEEKFEQLAGELRRVLCRQQPELEVRIARQIVRLPLTKIYYATAQNHYVRVVTDDGECRATANFAQVQEQLQTQPEFLVCNRGVIINMSKVLRFEGDCIEMLDGTHLPVRQKDKNVQTMQNSQALSFPGQNSRCIPRNWYCVNWASRLFLSFCRTGRWVPSSISMQSPSNRSTLDMLMITPRLHTRNSGAGGAHCPADCAAAADQDLLCYGTEPLCACGHG